jgi:hypothetical protein
MPQFPATKYLGLLTWNFMQLKLNYSNFNLLSWMGLLRQIAILS